MICPLCGDGLDVERDPNGDWGCARHERSLGDEEWVCATQGSGVTYHKERNCNGLRGGQQKVADRRGDPAPVVRMTAIEHRPRA